MMGGLGAEGAVLRAAPGLGVDDGTEFYTMAIVVIEYSAGSMEEEGDEIIVYPQEVLGRGCGQPPIIKNLLNALFDKLLHGVET
jgi:hypothetical protein